MGRFIMSPEQFKTLEADAQLQSNSKKIVSFTKTGDFTGVVETHDVTVDFNYDPTYQALNFTVGKKHSLAAKMASDNVIERHITEVLFELEKAPVVEQPKDTGTWVDDGQGLQYPEGTDNVHSGLETDPKPKVVGGLTVKPTIPAPQK